MDFRAPQGVAGVAGGGSEAPWGAINPGGSIGKNARPGLGWRQMVGMLPSPWGVVVLSLSFKPLVQCTRLFRTSRLLHTTYPP